MTFVRARPRLRGEVRTRLLVVAVAAIVLGILGMHGLAGHDTGSHLDASAQMVHGAAATDQVESGTGDPQGGAPAGMSGMTMTCGVMLAAAAITVLLLLVRRSPRPTLWAVLALADEVWRPDPGVRLRNTGPPNAWRFSVIRC